MVNNLTCIYNIYMIYVNEFALQLQHFLLLYGYNSTRALIGC